MVAGFNVKNMLEKPKNFSNLRITLLHIFLLQGFSLLSKLVVSQCGRNTFMLCS
jgi:hypothetical protein